MIDHATFLALLVPAPLRVVLFIALGVGSACLAYGLYEMFARIAGPPGAIAALCLIAGVALMMLALR